ncbi:hypothetical protein KDL30_01355 [bacterium]|nr:hypothetical protein [bacterium]
MLLLGSCGGDARTPELPAAGEAAIQTGNAAGSDSETATGLVTAPDAPIYLPAALREIAVLEAPADVDAEVFAELKAELARLLTTGSIPENLTEVSAPGLGDEPRSTSDAEFWDSDMDAYDEHLSRPVTSFTSSSPLLTAEYCVDGDYDQNGIVNAADLVPLAINIGRSPGKNRLLRHIDGDRNGIINIADIVPIARNYGTSPRMLLYGSKDIRDYPWQGSGPTLIAPLASDPPQEASTSESGLRQFSFSGFADQPEMYYWVGTAGSGRVSQLCYDPLQIRYTSYSRLSYDPASRALTYDEVAVGDSDRNSEVNVADIDDWAIHMDKTYSDAAESPFLAGLDFNRDGHIGSTDIISLPMFFTAWRPTTNVYMTLDEAELPLNAQIPVSEGPAPYASFVTIYIRRGGPLREDFPSQEAYEATEWYQNYAAHLPDSLLWHELILEDLPSGAWLWLRPVVDIPGSSLQVLGYPSEVIQIP